jgi:hypothetical protein
MKNIHILPTDKPSRLYIDNKGKYNLEIGQVDFKTFKNIYITSDEEIKEGNWYASFIFDEKTKWTTTKLDCVVKANLNKTNEYLVEPFSKYCKKIILTTDQDLIKDGIQEIDNEFLEWFVENPSCEEVEVDLFPKNSNKLYEIIIPKEEPKKEYNYIGECNGNNGNGCFMDNSGHDCGCFIRVLKEESKPIHEQIIDLCGGEERFKEIAGLKPRQEIKFEDVFNDEKRQGVKNLIDTHKQRLEKYSERFDNDKSEIGNPDTWGKRVVEEPKQETLEEGAKWQAEKMYSEEDMMDYSNYRLLIKKALSPKEWFEKFKNK